MPIVADIPTSRTAPRSGAPSPWNVKAMKKLKNSLESVDELVFSSSEQRAQSSDYQTDHQKDYDH